MPGARQPANCKWQCKVERRSVGVHGVDPGVAHAVALLVGAAPGTTLGPVEVHRQDAAVKNRAKALSSGTGSVGAVDRPVGTQASR